MYYEGGTVTFGDDSKGNIIGIGNIKIGSFLLIENVVLLMVSSITSWVLVNYMIELLKLLLMIRLAMF